MKTIIIILLVLLCSSNIETKAQDFTIDDEYNQLIFNIKNLSKVNPNDSRGKNSRTIYEMPSMVQIGHTIYIHNITSCSLYLLDTNDNIIYETPLEGNEKEVQLPSNIEGNFELQIIIENICYYTNIQL